MPLPIPNDTLAALGAGLKNCSSRSLWQDRFACPESKEEERKEWFKSLFAKAAMTQGLQSWARFLKLGTGKESGVLYAQLQSRLMVNMAGGVMENAGLCLDRFGMPYIPGSAVKGCARRAALAALREWTEEGEKPTGQERPLAAATEAFENRAQMLAHIALIFGWCEQDWKPNAEFHWATGQDSDRVLVESREELHRTLSSEFYHSEKTLVRNELSNHAGLVAFMPARPVELEMRSINSNLPFPYTEPGKLELDIINCHHKNYYKGILNVATDTEEPNPVFYPAVASGHVFAFSVRQLKKAQHEMMKLSIIWLRVGLEVMGIGGKVGSGYGWFAAGSEIQGTIFGLISDLQKRRAQALANEQAEAADRAEKVQIAEQKRIFKETIANLSPGDKEEFILDSLSDDQFRSMLDNFKDQSEERKKAIVRVLRRPSDQIGSRRDFWNNIKAKGERGGKSAKIVEAIRLCSRSMYSGKEGKMP